MCAYESPAVSTQKADASKFVNPHFTRLSRGLKQGRVRTSYLMKVDAKADGIIVHPRKLSSLAVLRACEGDTYPSSVDVHPCFP